jgi:hypothetical protein
MHSPGGLGAYEYASGPPAFLPVRIDGAVPVYYSSLQEACDDAIDGDTTQTHAAILQRISILIVIYWWTLREDIIVIMRSA